MKIPLLFFGVGGAGLAVAGTGVGVYYGIYEGEGNKVQTQNNLKNQDSDSSNIVSNQQSQGQVSSGIQTPSISPATLWNNNFFLSFPR